MSPHTENKIGLGTAVAIGLNAMIGIGIISVATTLSKSAGPAGIISYLFSIVVVISIALALGYVSRRTSSEGGWNYRYPAQWGGHVLGMLSVFAYLVGVVVAMGFLVQKVGEYGVQLVPFMSPGLLSSLTLIILTLLVVAGPQLSSLGQLLILASVLGSLAVTMLTCWMHFDPKLLMPFAPYGKSAIFFASPSALFGFLGFESISSLHAIVRNPNKNVPRATIISIVSVGIIYMLFVGGILFSIAPQFFGDNPTLDVLIARAFPAYAWVAVAVLIGVIFGIVGTLHSMIWSLGQLLTDVIHKIRSSRVQHVLHFLWRPNTATYAQWNARVSALLVATLMLLVSLFMRGDALVNMSVSFIIPSFVLSIVGALFVKEEWKNGHNIITVLALIGGSIMMYFAIEMVMISCAQIF